MLIQTDRNEKAQELFVCEEEKKQIEEREKYVNRNKY
jgi:hypothetical protein